jgi:hippurate hydrolase
VRTFDKAVQAMVMERMAAIVEGQALAYGVEAVLDYQVFYPATVNDPAKTAFAAEVAAEVGGAVEAEAGREMGAEDFAYFLEKRPGSYLFIGNGDTAGLHHAAYDFDDRTAPYGASFLARVVERAQPLR